MVPWRLNFRWTWTLSLFDRPWQGVFMGCSWVAAIALFSTPLLTRARARGFRARGGVLTNSAVIRLPSPWSDVTFSAARVMIGKSVSSSPGSEWTPVFRSWLDVAGNKANRVLAGRHCPAPRPRSSVLQGQKAFR